MLTDMNAQHIDRLDAAQVAAFNRVFSTRREDLNYFGYGLLRKAAPCLREDWRRGERLVTSRRWRTLAGGGPGP